MIEIKSIIWANQSKKKRLKFFIRHYLKFLDKINNLFISFKLFNINNYNRSPCNKAYKYKKCDLKDHR